MSVTTDCRCAQPSRPTGREPEQLPPWKCLACGGFACDYAEQGRTRCPSWRCDCFITTHPESPMDLHPEVFEVTQQMGPGMLRTMNLVVRPDGTAELDDRPGDWVVLAALGHRALRIVLTVDDRQVGTAYVAAANDDDANRVARMMCVELTGAHVAFAGPVVFTDLDAGTAHLLLELARD